jgi:hypothetical protein
MAMPFSAMPIYTSSNGDRWMLISDSDADQKMVRHTANPASGGMVTHTEVQEFLSRGGSGPEYGALRTLLNQFAEVEYRD